MKKRRFFKVDQLVYVYISMHFPSLKNSSVVAISQIQPVKNNRIALVRKLLVFLAAIIFCFSFFLMVNITSTMANTSYSDHMEGSLLESHDMDGDGLSNMLENMLGTDNDSKYGDLDNDGLYDFEEYLDWYGTPDNANDNPRYNYNDDTTYGNILDIYHYFNLTENKEDYIRDNSTYTALTGGFTNYLLWNVTFSASKAGGSNSSNVIYMNNLLVDVTFAEKSAGGSKYGNVTYENNLLRDVIFNNRYAGGSRNGNVVYMNNNLVNVTFSGGTYAGGSIKGTVVYMNNSLMDVNFAENTAGGSDNKATSYINNHLINVSFSGRYAGGSQGNMVTYENNVLRDVIFNNTYAGGSRNGAVVYMNNSLEDVTFSGEHAGGNDNTKTNVTYTDNTLISVIFSEKNTGLSAGTTGGNIRSAGDTGGFTIYRGNRFSNVQYAGVYQWASLSIISENNVIVSDLHDSDSDSLGDVRELFELTLNPVNKDSDGDSLNDGWEVLYSGSDYVNPLVEIDSTKLGSDEDKDSLTLSEEEDLGTSPSNNDTDGDGLNDSYEVSIKTSPINNDSDGDGLFDGWEFDYNGTSGVDPLGVASSSELNSDGDDDGLTLLEESMADTNPLINDTDGDGLLDGWEVRYADAPGVDPLDVASSSELNSDRDDDGLTLLEEFMADTDPSSNDTDDDGLFDGWEVRYSDAPGVDPLGVASLSELNSDGDEDGLTLLEESMADTNPLINDTDDDGLSDGWEVRYADAPGVDPFVKASSSELFSDLDSDGLTLLEESLIGTNPLNEDTDGDEMSDIWESTYSGIPGVDPIVKASSFELTSDDDNDGLSLKEEALAGTNPMLNDTDGDSLNDGWEVLYSSVAGIDPLDVGSSLDLDSDLDFDNLTLLEECIWGTDPLNNDTDDDGLNDGWESRYNDSYGVNPLITATNVELFSDRDGDGLTLLQEAIENMNPEIADNTEVSEFTSVVTQSTTNYYFALFAVIATSIIIAILIIAVTVIIRIRRYRKRTLQRWRKML